MPAGEAGALAGATLSGMPVGAGAGAPVGADGIIPGGDHDSTTHGGMAEASAGATPDGAGVAIGVILIGEDSVTIRIMDTTTDTLTIEAGVDTITIAWRLTTYEAVPIWGLREVAITCAIEAIADAQISTGPALQPVPALAIAVGP